MFRRFFYCFLHHVSHIVREVATDTAETGSEQKSPIITALHGHRQCEQSILRRLCSRSVVRTGSNRLILVWGPRKLIDYPKQKRLKVTLLMFLFFRKILIVSACISVIAILFRRYKWNNCNCSRAGWNPTSRSHALGIPKSADFKNDQYQKCKGTKENGPRRTLWKDSNRSNAMRSMNVLFTFIFIELLQRDSKMSW